MNTTSRHETVPVSDGSVQAASFRQTGFLFIFLTVFLDILGMTVLIPVSVYIIQQYNTSATVVGLLSATYAAAQFLAAPLLGQLSDRFGRRPLLLESICGSAIGYLLFGIGGSLWILFISRLIDGLTAGNLSVAQAFIADVSQPKDRTRNFALIGIAYGLGFILGPAIGGGLGQIHITLPAYVAAGLSFAGAILGFFTLQESLPVEKRSQKPVFTNRYNPLSAIGSVLREERMSGLLVSIFLFNFAFNGMTSNLGFFALSRFGIQPAKLAFLLVLGGISNLLVQGILRQKRLDSISPTQWMKAGLAAQCIAYLIMSLINSFWMLYPLYIFVCVGNALVFPTQTTLLMDAADPEEQGKITGVNASLTGLTSFLAPFWTGLLFDHLSPAAPYLSFCVLVFGAFWVISQQPGQNKENLHDQVS
jgi:MFS family permease